MFDVLLSIVEMRGPSIVSLLCLLFLFKILKDQHVRIKELRHELGHTKDCLEDKINKTLERSNTIIMELKNDVGKQTESIKGLCKTLDNMQSDIRQMRELRTK